LESSGAEIEQKRQNKATLDEKLQELKSQLAAKKKELSEMEQQRQKDGSDKKFKQLEKEAKEEAIEYVRLNTEWKHLKEVK